MKDNAIARAVGKTLSQPEKTLRLTVNSQEQEVVVAPDTPLLYVLRGELQLNGPRFGCGLAQCGACTVHLDGKPIRSCVTPVAIVVGHKITTLEGLAATYKGSHAGASSNASPRTAGLDRRTGPAMRKLPEWLDYVLGPLARHGSQTDRESDSGGAERAQMPLWISGGHTSCRPARRPNDGGGVR